MSLGYQVHEGVSCDGCGHTNFQGNRYKCLRCIDFDLCHQCFVQKRFPNSPQAPDHHENHPMQMILTPKDFEVVYEGDSSKNYDVCKIGSFTCPICNHCGLNIHTFANHVAAHSVNPELKVICPLCIAFPGDSNTQHIDLKDHIAQIHSHLDSAYRAEPQVRATSRRPVLARRTQRQPAGQAGTFAQQALGISLGPMGWPNEEMEEMFRFAQNRGTVNAANVPAMIGITGQALSAQDQAAVLQHFQSLQRDQAGSLRAMNFMTNQLARGQPAVSRHSEYAQPRQAAPRQPTISQPIARLTRTTPIFPHLSEDAEDLTGDENDFCSGDEGVPQLENESLDGDIASTSAEAGESDYTALLSDAISREPSIKKPSTASNDTDSEFEFEQEGEDDSTQESEGEVEETAEVGEEEVRQSAIPSHKDIIASLRGSCTEAEYQQVMRILEEEETDDEEDAPEPIPLLSRENSDSLEDQLGKLVWSTIQFDVPPLNTFGYSDGWTDKRFLRHRKLHRELSTASTTEDTLEKTDVALSLLQVAAGGNSSRCRVFDKLGRSVRRSLADLKLTEGPALVHRETTNPSVSPPEINHEPQELVGNGMNGIVRVQETEKSPGSPTVKFLREETEEGSSPSDGESSEDEEGSSLQQDDVQFIEE